MATITIDKAEKELAELIRRACAGEEIVISDEHGKGVILAPIEQAAQKGGRPGRGLLKGQARVSDEDLFGPLPEDELKRWWGEGQ